MRYRLYIEWAKENGVIMDKVRSNTLWVIDLKLVYPAVFNLDGTGENLLTGSAARTMIKPNEVYLYVPSKILITVDKALRSKEIGHVFSENAFFFKNTEDRDYLVLLVFLLYEHQKGK